MLISKDLFHVKTDWSGIEKHHVFNLFGKFILCHTLFATFQRKKCSVFEFL